ncbi:MAG: hypothetical protein C0616_05700 [Desulfuromonas sp.]|nr:MAG: hypothetical protein C0616_05700 [Desulfuromonas sp.]
MKPRVLVVDDHENIRFSFAEFLSGGGFNVDAVETAEEAIELIRTVEHDAVFLDIFIGGDSGIDLLKEIKERNPNCPAIMVTGAPDVDTAADAVRLGAFDYLKKPILKKELLLHAGRAVAYKDALDKRDQVQKRMSAIFHGVSDGILVFDSNNVLVQVNDAAKDILGLNDENLEINFAEIADKKKSAILNSLKQILELRLEGELYKLEFDQGDGARMVVSVCMSPVKTHYGVDDDFVMVIRDESKPNFRLSV